MASPEEPELAATVARMEARLVNAPGWGDYEALRRRFADDLPQPRDRLLACSAALMQLQQANPLLERTRDYLRAYADKDLDTIKRLIAEEVLLRDWQLQVRGRAAFLAETQKNFDGVQRLRIDILGMQAGGSSVSAELRIELQLNATQTVELFVVDVLDFDAQGRISAIRAYKGRGDAG